jgi:DNA-binding response OmpR family regulator
MQPKHKILIVDDDPTNVEILYEIFEDTYTLARAGTGEEALAVLPRFLPDLILLDIMMPGLDGYEICRRIRSDSCYSFIKIILVSGKAMVEERLKGYEAGADDYITKPFVHEELEAKVSVFLRLKRSEELDQLKGDLLSLLSRETQVSINGIIPLKEVLREVDSLNQEVKEYVYSVEERFNLVYDWIEKTTLLCDLKLGMAPSASRESVVRHLHSTVTRLEEEARGKGVAFDPQLEEDADLALDWNLMDKVFEYVLGNAVKYSPRGGTVTVRTEIYNNSCRVRIIDEGSGVQPAWKDKIFDETAMREIIHDWKGRGLSLPISKCVMDLHGGTIEADDNSGKGTIFSLNLPLGDQSG